MSKRKGVSADEKRTRLLELFYEKKEFFQLKDLERIAPKEKGIVAQSVKDVLQSLVDEGLVDSDKIGTSIYYWAFKKCKARGGKKAKLETITTELHTYKNKLNIIENKLSEEKGQNKDVEAHNEAIKTLTELQNVKADLLKELQKYTNCDPEYLDKLKKNIHNIKESTNRWIENLFLIKSWCTNKFMIDGKLLNKQFGIPEDLDYIDI